MYKKNMPMFGPGPFYATLIITVTAVACFMNYKGYFSSGMISDCQSVLRIVSSVLIIVGALLWIFAVIGSRVGEHIKRNELVTHGVYAWVRNPIYSAFMLLCWGALLCTCNIYMISIAPMYWIFLTIVVKQTEEKWLVEMFGDEYLRYCERVNRCIPFPPCLK